uniref:protein O-GlcNAcase n=1 Tax=Electrophorus electricus TaxID=8005 RepID=A0A4W4HBN5_ELEEL
MSKTTANSSRMFLSGVVEGFYGRPWTMEQRKTLFTRVQKWGLNTYLYAPKNDYKHRMYWRELYTSEEAEQLIALISAAKERNVEFVYAISPGLDITFSNPKEVAALKRKLSQVCEFGCRSFALLFDDIETEMCAADKELFSSSAHAQVSITNQVFQHLQELHTFLFCPTDYCAAFCTPSVTQSSYLHTVGEKLLPEIDVLWTGPKVVSKEISVESIEEVSGVLRRPPVIWDNIHANDYDPQRLFLGPFKNRSTELIPKLRGVLTNPNCEFELNFVAIHTLATWCKCWNLCLTDGKNPNLANTWPRHSILVWAVSRTGSGRPKRESSEEEPMQTDEHVPGPRENPLYTAEPLTLDDLTLLSELFYLPYEHGPTALAMLREVHWLRANSDAATFGHAAAADSGKVSGRAKEWQERAQHFDDMCSAVIRMFNRLSNAPNRTVLYDLYNYICDIKSGVSLAKAFVNSLGRCHNPPPSQVITDDPEPWGFRGGLSGEFQRMLPCHGNRDLFRTPLATRVYAIRPCTPKDKSDILRLSKEMQSETLQHAALIGDGLVEGQLAPSKHCDLVLEDDEGLCGFTFGLADAKVAMTKSQVSGRECATKDLILCDIFAYPEMMLRDFPSLITVQIHPRVPDPCVAKRLIASVLSSLRDSGSTGVFCEFRSNDKRMLDFLKTLEVLHVLKVDGLQAGLVLMGTKL